MSQQHTPKPQLKNRKQFRNESLNHNLNNYHPERYALPGDYYSIPSQQEIFASNGKINSLIVGNRHGFAYWTGNIDISTLREPLSSIINIEDLSIEVYACDRNKPRLGHQLNRSCQVTFHPLKPVSCPQLKKICDENQTVLLKMSKNHRHFTVHIPHFTRYSFHQAPRPKKLQSESNQREALMVSGINRNIMVENREGNRQQA